MKLFFHNLKKAKNNLLKKIIIKNISKNYLRKILSNRFTQWKLNSLKKENENQLQNINKLNELKNIVNNAIKRRDKSNYASLKKAINKWNLISKLINKENSNKLLLNLKNAVGKINNLFIKNLLKEPFNKLKLAEVNKKSVILKRLKKYFLKNDEINLRKAFRKFMKNESPILLKAKNIYNLKEKYSQLNNQTYLAKYFNRWKLLSKIKNEEKIIKTKVLANSLNNLMKKKLQKDAFDKLKYKKRKFYLNELIKKLVKLYEIKEKRCLLDNLLKLKNISKKISFNISQRKKHLKLYVKYYQKHLILKNLLIFYSIC